MYNRPMLNHSRANSDALIEEIKRLEAAEPEVLIERIWLVRAERGMPHLSATETKLLSQINESVLESEQLEITGLNEKMQSETLSESERLQLISLHQKAEKLQAQRLEAISELAKPRGITPKHMLEKLGIAA
jgi:hypothetical protein